MIKKILIACLFISIQSLFCNEDYIENEMELVEKNSSEVALTEEEFKSYMNNLNNEEKDHFQFCMNKIVEIFNNLKNDDDLKLLEESLKKINVKLKLFITIVPFKINNEKEDWKVV